MAIITIDEFRASGVDCDDIGSKISGQDLEACTGRVYLDTLCIERWGDDRHGNAPPNGATWLLTLGNMQHAGALADLELELYRWALDDTHLVTDDQPAGVKHEFPGFSAFDIPLLFLDSGWSDRSWHNDAMPFFVHEPSGLGAWINFAEMSDREMPDRFVAVGLEWDHATASWMHDSRADRPAFFVTEDEETFARSVAIFARTMAIAHAFALRIEDLGPDTLAEIRRRNAETTYRDACATHDFVDANMLMLEAFEKVVGKPFIPKGSDEPTQEHFSLWNLAWSMARSDRLSDPSSKTTS